MDDFSREFCNWDKLREKRNGIKTEIDSMLKFLNIEKEDMEYRSFLNKININILNKYEDKYEDKLSNLINIYNSLCDIEFNLTQIRLNNIYIKNFED